MKIYRITVIEIDREEQDVREWVKLREPREGDDSSEYGYVDNRKMVKTERTVLTQEVDKIDTARIIRAINSGAK